MVRILSILTILYMGSPMAAATPPRDLLEAVGFHVVEPAKTAPAVALDDHLGRPFTTQDQRGKVIMINFWATWCPPCIYEMPLMEQLFLSLQGRPFSLWALNVQETQEQVATFLHTRNFHFPVLLDPDGLAVSRYQVKGLPSTYLIDCAGHLIGAITGVLKWTDSAMSPLLEMLFKDPACQATTAPTTRPHPASKQSSAPTR